MVGGGMEIVPKLAVRASTEKRKWLSCPNRQVRPASPRPMQRVSQQQLKTLSRNIRRLREHAGLTQEGLAEKADISPRSLQFIEAAQFGASLAVLIRLRRALDCRWDSLLDGIE